MKFVGDFHIHSKYSRATSKKISPEILNYWANVKGIKVLGTGDFTHPAWLQELKGSLKEAEPGLYRVNDTRFILSSEISCIYSKGGKVRKIHIVVLSPSFEDVEKINESLGRIGNLKSDGRPILGLDAKELVKIILENSPRSFIIPAHILTPWFSLFGSKSGFNSIEECFEDYSKYIFAVETGLSADCPMLWRMSALDNISLISNSDAHSPRKLGREANVFDTELSYNGIIGAIKSKDPKKFLYTIEFFPQEGKYHYDGHRTCGLRASPEEAEKYNNICPRCGKPLTLGVCHRVKELADKEKGTGAIPFKSLIPLEEVIAESLGYSSLGKRVEREYQNLVKKIGSEFDVLLKAGPKELRRVTLPEIAQGIIKARKGEVAIEPGYDGVFGEVNVFSVGERKKEQKQITLFG